MTSHQLLTIANPRTRLGADIVEKRARHGDVQQRTRAVRHVRVRRRVGLAGERRARLERERQAAQHEGAVDEVVVRPGPIMPILFGAVDALALALAVDLDVLGAVEDLYLALRICPVLPRAVVAEVHVLVVVFARAVRGQPEVRQRVERAAAGDGFGDGGPAGRLGR